MDDATIQAVAALYEASRGAGRPAARENDVARDLAEIIKTVRETNAASSELAEPALDAGLCAMLLRRARDLAHARVTDEELARVDWTKLVHPEPHTFAKRILAALGTSSRPTNARATAKRRAKVKQREATRKALAARPSNKR